MLNSYDILETISMIEHENLDIRTITMGISLLDCFDSDIDRAAQKDLPQGGAPGGDRQRDRDGIRHSYHP